jgi:hypothetical protein
MSDEGLEPEARPRPGPEAAAAGYGPPAAAAPEGAAEAAGANLDPAGYRQVGGGEIGQPGQSEQLGQSVQSEESRRLLQSDGYFSRDGGAGRPPAPGAAELPVPPAPPIHQPLQWGTAAEQPAAQPQFGQQRAPEQPYQQPQHAAGQQWGPDQLTAQSPFQQQASPGQRYQQQPAAQQQYPQQQYPQGAQFGQGAPAQPPPQYGYQAQHQFPPQHYPQAPQNQPQPPYQQPPQYPQRYQQYQNAQGQAAQLQSEQPQQSQQPPQYAQQPQYQQPGDYQYTAAPNWQWPPAEVVPPTPKVSGRVKAGAAAILVLALAAVGGGVAVAKAGGGGAAASRTTGTAAQDQKVESLWRTASAGDLLPLSLSREGTETYQRIGVDPDESCSVLPAALLAALHPGSCAKVIQATYVDRTQTVTATVGIVVISGSATVRQSVYKNWTPDANAANTAMMPDTYPIPGTAAANFQNPQRVAWESNILDDGSYLVYTVAGFTDGRPGPSAADRSSGTGSALGSDSPPVQVAGDLPTAISQILVAQETTILGTSGS